MSRPELVRADTLDLQDQDAPSAKDHTLQPTQPASLGEGPPAPHQQQALRNVEEERTAEQHHFAWASHEVTNEQIHDDYDDTNDTPHDATYHSHFGTTSDAQPIYSETDHAEAEEADADELMEDDMMDRISSSPSIDDGGFQFPSLWPHGLRPLRAQSNPQKKRTGTPEEVPTPKEVRRTSVPQTIADLRRGYDVSPVEDRVDRRIPLSLKSFVTPTPIDNYTLELHTLSKQHHHQVGGQYIQSLEDVSMQSRQASRLRKIMGRRDSLSSISGPPVEIEGQAGRPARLRRSSKRVSAANHLPDVQVRAASATDDLLYSPASASNNDSDSLYETAVDDDAYDPFSHLDSRHIDSGWGGECLRDTEDIDFEFVYALHTFVATVEGQANAAKGDTMVLLDDENSYWWLVRLVKDSSIGYLPAEHIETPTERLARLNKHRNIDLSAAMLGDIPERSKNPLKKAMRRRNAKMVTFAAPQYREASEVEWSESESDSGDMGVMQSGGLEHQQEQEFVDHDTAVVHSNGQLNVGPGNEPTIATSTQQTSSIQQYGVDSQDQQEFPSRISRNGTLRDTDSFFKDDNAEVKKISLTPNLLRDDASSLASPRSIDSRERSVNSPDTFEEMSRKVSPTETGKKKEKKPGMLRGLFNRRTDKKGKIDNAGRSQAGDSQLSIVSSNESERAVSYESTASSHETQYHADTIRKQMSSGRSLKSPPPASDYSITSIVRPNANRSYSSSSVLDGNAAMPSLAQALQMTPSPTAFSKASYFASSAPQQGAQLAQEGYQQGVMSPVKIQPPVAIGNGLGLVGSHHQPTFITNPGYAELDNTERLQSYAGMNTEPTLETYELPAMIPQTTMLPLPTRAAPLPPTSVGGSDQSGSQAQSTYASYSATVPSSGPPSWSQPTLRVVPSASTNISTQSSETVENFTAASSSSAMIPTTSTIQETKSDDWDDNWNDAALLKYLDKRGHNDAKDMLLLVHDRHNVPPVGHDHPIMMALGYQQKQQQLNTMQGQLDRLLNDWVAKKAQRKGRLGHETGIRLARAEALKKRLG